MKFHCPHCRQVMTADASLHGKPCICAYCQRPLIAPTPPRTQPAKKGIAAYVWFCMLLAAAIIFLPILFPNPRSENTALTPREKFLNNAKNATYNDGYKVGKEAVEQFGKQDPKIIQATVSNLRKMGFSESYLAGWWDALKYE